MKLFIAKNKKIGDKVAFHVIKNQISKKPNSLIGFAVGKTTDNLYKLISKEAKKNPKRWARLKIFQIDEKLGIGPESPWSFNHELKRELKSLLNVTKQENVFLINGLENPREIIKKGYRFIKQNKGIDLIILGLGPSYDPHIAYNTSGKSPISSTFRVVNLHPKIGKKIKTRKGITLGIKDILKSKKALLIAYGTSKAKSLSLALAGKVDTKVASGSALQLHKDLTVVADKESSKLM